MLTIKNKNISIYTKHFYYIYNYFYKLQMQYCRYATYWCYRWWYTTWLGYPCSFNVTYSFSWIGSFKTSCKGSLPLSFVKSISCPWRSSRSSRRSTSTIGIKNWTIGLRALYSSFANTWAQFYRDRSRIWQLFIWSTSSTTSYNISSIIFTTTTLFFTSSSTSATTTTTSATSTTRILYF